MTSFDCDGLDHSVYVDAAEYGMEPSDFLDEGEIHDMDDDFGIIPFHRVHVDEWAEETEEEDE